MDLPPISKCHTVDHSFFFKLALISNVNHERCNQIWSKWLFPYFLFHFFFYRILLAYVQMVAEVNQSNKGLFLWAITLHLLGIINMKRLHGLALPRFNENAALKLLRVEYPSRKLLPAWPINYEPFQNWKRGLLTVRGMSRKDIIYIASLVSDESLAKHDMTS